MGACNQRSGNNYLSIAYDSQDDQCYIYCTKGNYTKTTSIRRMPRDTTTSRSY